MLLFQSTTLLIGQLDWSTTNYLDYVKNIKSGDFASFRLVAVVFLGDGLLDLAAFLLHCESSIL